ncbi:MAG TPA: PA2778 family cysteine peptidase [Steroidobacteraceae bacterium]|nr:PA2778 family cysteine peptidase [Steroidobacteraceae bacterium]
MMSLRQAAATLAAACCLLAGCAARTPLLAPDARGVELADTPFYPQEKYQCGPAALATVLAVAGVRVTPEELVPQVYLPSRKGSLTIEMQAAPRRHGVLSYPLAPTLDAIVAELEAGRPVLVLHNYGLPFWPRWHYAVVIGYDAPRQRMLLRSGTTERQSLSAANFMRAWDNADRWAMVLLRPGELPARPDLPRYLEAATAFERAAVPADAERAFGAAAHLWPDDPVAWVGRGTARYRAGDWRAAADDYAHALGLAPDLPAPRNNLAMALLKLGCPAAARRHLDQIDASTLDASMRAAVADTSSQVQALAATTDNGACSALY